MTKLAKYLIAASLLLMVGAVALIAASNNKVANPSAPNLVLVESAPVSGTFFSMQLDLPPLPFNPMPTLDLFSFDTEPGTYYFDDTSVDYAALAMERQSFSFDSASGLGGGMMMFLSDMPPPPGDGGGSGTNTTNILYTAYNYTTNDLWLEILGKTNTSAYLRIHSPVPNAIYDVFSTTNLRADVPGLNFTNWLWVLRTTAGQTNVTVTGATDPVTFFKLGTMLDTDGEGLTDAYENLVSHTLTNNVDTDGDGLSDYYEVSNGLDPWDASDNRDDDYDGLTQAFEIVVSGTEPTLWDTDSDDLSDGDEINPATGIPWILEQAKATNVIIYPNLPTATEGGANGQFTIRLPSPAPSGGKKVEFYIAGSSELASDYTLSVSTNALTIPSGASTGTITVTAINDTAPSSGSRTVELILTNAPGLVVFPRPAQVRLVDNDPQRVRVFASAAEGSEGTNAITYTLVREGTNTAALTVNLGWSGLALRGTDYATASAPATKVFPAGDSITSISFVPTLDSTEEGEESVTLTVGSGTGYVVDTNAATATAWITEASLPTVSISVIDADAREQGPKSAVLKVSRIGSSRDPLEVRLEDRRPLGYRNYTCLSSNSLLNMAAIIPAGTNEIRVYFTPENDSYQEIRESVPIALAGSTHYRINTNSYVAEVLIEDNETASYDWEQDKATAAYTAGSVDSPVTLTFYRTGSTANQADYAFTVSNPSGSYVIAGNVNGSNIRFPAGSAIARVHVHARSSSGGLGFGSTHFMQGGSAQVHFVGGDKLVFAKVTSTNNLIAIEGGSKKAKVQVSRAVTSANATTVYFDLGGSALSSEYTLTGIGLTKTSDTTWSIPANASSGEIEITATTDAAAEGFETLVFQLQTTANSFSHVPTNGALATVLLRDSSTTNAMPFVDSDGDFLSDFYELAFGLDPAIAQPSWRDSDGDGLSDRIEQAYGLNPKSQKTNPSGPGDFLAVEYADAGVANAEQFALAFPVDRRPLDFNHPLVTTGPVTLRISPGVAYGEDSPVQGGIFTAEALVGGATYELRMVPNSGTPGSATYTRALTPYSIQHWSQEFLHEDGHTGDGFVLSDPQDILGYDRPVGTGLSNKVAHLHVANPRMFVDLDRDGVISTNRTDATALEKPFRFWTNGDKDSNEVDTSDVGADTDGHALEVVNGTDSLINGESDLVDFFPLRLDLEELLKYAKPSLGYQYRLRHADGAVNIAYTHLSRTNAFGYLYQTNIAWPLRATNTLQVTTNGLLLATNWLAGITNGRGGILLVEGRSATTNALVLEVSRYQTQWVAWAELHLSLSPVEKMYRHKSLTDAANLATEKAILAGGRGDSTTAPPNWPDTLSTNRNFVFVHGYNVNPWQARGWNSEVFKRLWQSGSRAKFIGTTWRGHESQSYIPGVGHKTKDYQVNLRHAFATADDFAAFLASSLPPGATTVAAHSLGNGVVGSAISDWSAPVSRYLMLDAAVAKEAYDASEAFNTNMVHPYWLGFTNRLWATEWHQLFPPNDARNKLTWRGRLSNFGSAQYFNYYSSGEDVLGLHTANDLPTVFDAAVADNVLNVRGKYTWGLQEKLKGTMLTKRFGLSSSYGGWGYPDHYSTTLAYLTFPLTPSQAALLTDTQLRQAPFFKIRSLDQWFRGKLFRSDGSEDAAENRDQYLAEAFPARTLPAGANSFQNILVNRNFDMQTAFKSGWPRARALETDPPDRVNWRHSDLRGVAFLYTWPLFTNMVFNGNLK